MHLEGIKNLPHEHVEVEHLLWILCINLLLLAAQWTVTVLPIVGAHLGDLMTQLKMMKCDSKMTTLAKNAKQMRVPMVHHPFYLQSNHFVPKQFQEQESSKCQGSLSVENIACR